MHFTRFVDLRDRRTIIHFNDGKIERETRRKEIGKRRRVKKKRRKKRHRKRKRERERQTGRERMREEERGRERERERERERQRERQRERERERDRQTDRQTDRQRQRQRQRQRGNKNVFHKFGLDMYKLCVTKLGHIFVYFNELSSQTFLHYAKRFISPI